MTGTNIFIGEEDLKDDGPSIQAYSVQKWVTARPVGYIGFWHRMSCALKVLKGRADIVIWKVKENQE